MQSPSLNVTKKKAREAVQEVARNLPFYKPNDVTQGYAKLFKINITEPQVAFDLGESLTQKGYPSGNSIRSTMADVCDKALKDMAKTVTDLPLKVGGPTITMERDEFRNLGCTTTLEGPQFELMFNVLSVLHTRLSADQQTPFDGYFSLDLVVWYLIKVALDKELVRCVR